MELDRLCLELRRRTVWEAVDLGLPVLRCWAGPVYRGWFATYVPFSVAMFTLLWDRPWLAWLLVWWFKPLFDRILLYIYAGAIFGERIGAWAVWRAIPGIMRQSGLVAGLLWGRFDMARAFHLPVWQLERQSGSAGRQRRRLLDRKTRACASWLLFVCANVSVFLQLSLVLLLDWFWPGEAPPLMDWEAMLHGEATDQPWQAAISNLSFLIGESLVEPFYVAAGFTLYLNRRNDLEGWDIELGFRRLTERVRKEAGVTRGLPAWAWLGILALLFGQVPGDLHAATGTAQAGTPSALAAGPARRKESEASRAIRVVLQDPVFGREVPDWEWRKRLPEPEDQSPSSSPRLDWVRTWLDWLARGIRLLSFAAAGVLVAVLAVLAYRHRHDWLIRPGGRRRLPETLFGLDLCPQSLPDDIAGSARQVLDTGDIPACLSLLYRGSLVALLRSTAVEFRPGDTEGDCLRRVKGQIDRRAELYFAELLYAWTHTAYAHEALETVRVERLCARWDEHFAGLVR